MIKFKEDMISTMKESFQWCWFDHPRPQVDRQSSDLMFAFDLGFTEGFVYDGEKKVLTDENNMTDDILWWIDYIVCEI